MPRLEDKVVHALEALNLESPEIEVGASGTSVFATVVSGSFGGMDVAARQKLVWDGLRGSLTEFEAAAVEFVFTYAPGEDEHLEEEAV